MPSRTEDIEPQSDIWNGKVPDAFHCLVRDLSDTLGPSSGLNSADVDPNNLLDLMQAYTSKESEWSRYAWGDASRAYTRNLVDKGNGKSNLLILVWTPGRGSPVHDHANAHCVMKVLQGSLKETQYYWPEKNTDSSMAGAPLQIKKETVFMENEVTYMSDQLGLHKISNTDSNNIAVSLHLYTPPNAMKLGCNLFDERTGRASHVQQCHFFSELGRKL